MKLNPPLSLRQRSFLRKLSLVTCIAISPMISSADSLQLSDGSTIQGKILEQTLDYYLIKTEVSPNVFINKKVLKKNVVSIKKDDASLEPFNTLKSFFPVKDLATKKHYAALLSKHIQPFLEKFPRSPFAKQVEVMKQNLADELDKINRGGLKINGKWLTPEQVEYNLYEISALVEFEKFKKLAKSKRYLSAMRQFDTLESQFTPTVHYRQACKIATIILPRYKKLLKKLESNIEENLKKRERTIELLSDEERARILPLFKNEDIKYERALTNARSILKTKWLPLNKYQKEPVSEVITHIEQELERIKGISKSPLNDAGSIFRKAYLSIESGQLKLADDQIQQLERAKVPSSILLPLKKKLAHKRLAKEAAQKAAAAKKQAEEEAAKKKKSIPSKDKAVN